MSSKFNVVPSVRDHYGTLVDQNDPAKPHLPDYLAFVGLPIGTGVAAGLLMWWRETGLFALDSFIGGVAILTGLLFALVIHVFQLRMTMSNDERIPPGGDLLKFTDQLFANVNYAVIAGVVTTVVAMSASALTSHDPISPIWSGALVALATHLLLTVFMCIKRVRKAYNEIAKLPRITRV